MQKQKAVPHTQGAVVRPDSPTNKKLTFSGVGKKYLRYTGEALDRRALSYYAAGRLFITEYHGLPFSRVRINTKTEPFCQVSEPAPNVTGLKKAERARLLGNRAFALMAGPIAERMHRAEQLGISIKGNQLMWDFEYCLREAFWEGTNAPQWIRSDFHQANVLLNRVVVKTSVSGLSLSTADELEREWPAVRALASALYRQKSLSRKEVIAIIRQKAAAKAA